MEGIGGIVANFEYRQLTYLPIVVPDPKYIHIQSGGILAFDPAEFPAEFVKGLVGVEESAITTYPITVYEDSRNRERVILNARNERIGGQHAPRDYDPQWYVKEQYPELADMDPDAARHLIATYDPSRVLITYDLLPVGEELIQYVWKQSIDAAIRAEKDGAGGGGCHQCGHVGRVDGQQRFLQRHQCDKLLLHVGSFQPGVHHVPNHGSDACVRRQDLVRRLAMDFVFDAAGCSGSASPTSALAQLTGHLHSGHGMVYDCVAGTGDYGMDLGTNGNFELTDYMKSEPWARIDCTDQAGALTVLSRLMGLASQYLLIDRFGYIYKTDLVGIGLCNNPFYPHGSLPLEYRVPLLGTNGITDLVWNNRTAFFRHTFIVGNTSYLSPVRGVYMTNGASLIGFTVSSGRAKSIGDDEGGGIWCEPDGEAPVVAGCVVTGCWGQIGGGIYGGTRIDWKGGRRAWQFLECSTGLTATNTPWTPILALPPANAAHQRRHRLRRHQPHSVLPDSCGPIGFTPLSFPQSRILSPCSLLAVAEENRLPAAGECGTVLALKYWFDSD